MAGTEAGCRRCHDITADRCNANAAPRRTRWPPIGPQEDCPRAIRGAISMGGQAASPDTGRLAACKEVRARVRDNVSRINPGCADGCLPCDMECAITSKVRDQTWLDLRRLFQRPASEDRSERIAAAQARWEAAARAAELARPPQALDLSRREVP